MAYIGIDLGGTNIKAAVVNDDCQVIAQADLPTRLPRPAEEVCDDIILAMEQALDKAGLGNSDVKGLGVGCPGTIDAEEGIVRYSNNLDWHQFPMREYIRERTGLYAAMGNDANVAALGEVWAGVAKGTQSAVVITLGTGVGSGVVLNGEILTGYNGAAAEIGHMVIADNGPQCTCGRKGCFEVYSSATGLIRMTREAIENYPASTLATIAKENKKVNGRTAFAAMKQGDVVAKQVVEQYIHYLSCGLANIINIFQPEIIALSGGISNEGENLLTPLRDKVYTLIYGGKGDKYTRIEQCTLGYKAGLIGAAMLSRQG